MSYFLKKSRNKKGTYLQIYESTYDPERGYGVHRSVRAVGYVHELEAQGIEDPVAHFGAEVEAMNAEARRERLGERAREIGDSTPRRWLGHFAVRAIWAGLGLDADLGLLQLLSGFRFSVAELLEDLACARVVCPCSKSRTFHDVIPLLGGEPSYSIDQLYDGLAFLGREYKKVIEILNDRIARAYPRDTSRTYFDGTNFYFEIDREDGLRRKGMSKEHRKDPIVGMGLLLDASCVPLGMDVYAGNESEKPKLRKVISELKEEGGIDGRTVRVADEGLNCADNVADAVLAGDGYLFSRSARQLPKKEEAWVTSEDGWEDHYGDDGKVHHRTKSVTGDFEYKVTGEDGRKRAVSLPEKRVVTFNEKLRRKHLHEINRQVEKARRLRASQAKRSEYGDSAKYVKFVAVDKEGETGDDDVVAATLDHEAIARAKRLAGYNMLVTSERTMPDAEIYRTYHRLTRIEETFKVMKSQLEARPVYLQREDSITGHFLVCYVAVVLVRLLQIHVLDDRFGSEQVVGFMRGFEVVRVSDRKFVNVAVRTEVGDALRDVTGLPINLYHLTKAQCDKILSYRFKGTKDAA